MLAQKGKERIMTKSLVLFSLFFTIPINGVSMHQNGPEIWNMIGLCSGISCITWYAGYLYGKWGMGN